MPSRSQLHLRRMPWANWTDSSGFRDPPTRISAPWTGTEPYCCMDFTQATIEPAAPNPNGVTTQFLRASEATVLDYEGNLVTVPADVPRFQGARFVNNLILDSASEPNYIWRTIVTPNVDEVNGIVYNGYASLDGTVMDLQWQNEGHKELPEYFDGMTFTFSCYIKKAPGSPTTYWRMSIVGGEEKIITIDHEEPKRYSVIQSITLDEAELYKYIRVRLLLRAPFNIDTDIHVGGIMVEFTHHQTNRNPAEYVESPAPGAQFFPYLNGTTIDANGVVTEAQGAPIRGITYLNEPAATNYIEHSSDPSQWLSTAGIESVPDNLAISPLGRSVPYTQATLTNDIHRAISEPAPAGPTRIQLYFRPGSGSNLYRFSFYNATDGAIAGITVNVAQQNGEVIDGDNGARYRAIGDGWFFVELWGTTTADSRLYIYFSLAGTFLPNPDTGLYLDGCQMESGDVSTSFIPTAGASVTREADDLRYIGGPTAEISIQIGFESGAAIPNSNDFRLFGSKSSDNNEIRTAGANNWNFGISAGGFYQNMNDIAAGKRVFSGGYENGNQKVYLDGGQRNVQAVVWSPSHSNQYIQLGRWKDQPTTIPLRFSTFKLWNSALPDDELKALSGQDWNCPED